MKQLGLVHSGMVEAIAQSAAAAIGPNWPMFAPAIGALGSFVTGSATSSNILLGELQLAAAEEGGWPNRLAVGQAFGGAGNMIAPHNIVAGAATVRLLKGEAPVLRQTALPCLVYVLSAGAVLGAVLVVLD